MSPIEDFEQVIAELERGDKFLLTTHQNPDGDALGSLIGMHELLTRLGKDSVMFLAEDQFPLPHEYRHMRVGRRACRLRPRTWASALRCSSTAATSTACRWTSSSARVSTSSTSTTITTTRASAP